MLLLLPFLASFFLFPFSLNHYHYGNSCCDHNNPSHYSVESPFKKIEQITTVQQTAKSHPAHLPSTDAILFKTVFRVTEPSRPAAGRIYPMPYAATAYQPPTLFPNRASPVIRA